MPSYRLKQLLQQMHTEVNNLDESSQNEKEKIEQLIDEIESALADRDKVDQHASLLDSLRGKLGELEADHPTTTVVVQRLLQTLSDMGI